MRTAFISGFGSQVADLGGDPELLLSRAGLRPDIEKSLDSFMPFQRFIRLLEVAANYLDCPDFGLRLSTRQGLPVLGPLSVLAGNLSTVESAFQAIARYMYLQIPAMKLDMQTDDAKRHVRILISVVDSSTLSLAQFLEFIVGNGQKITQILAGAKLPAQQIYFPHQSRGSKSAYRRFFGCKVNFSQTFCAVDLPMSLINKAIRSADPKTAELAVKYLATQPGRSGFRGQLVHLVHALLPTGHCNIRVIAEQLNLHPRTLQRRLADLSLLFEEIVDTERRLLAQRYLTEPGLTLTHIAGLLGYADQSTLNRSCRRWFNATPKQFRDTMK